MSFNCGQGFLNSLHPPSKFSQNEKIFLLLITASGAAVRIIYFYKRPFFGDDIGTLIYIDKDFSYILSHFSTWLTMNYFIGLEKLVAVIFGKNPFFLKFIPITAGILTIPLTALLALRFSSSRVAMVAAALTAMNPCLIHYSGFIRSYSLLAAISILVIIQYFKWHTARTYQHGIMVSIWILFLVLIHPNGAYTVAYLLFLMGVEFLNSSEKKEYINSAATLLIPLITSFLLIAASYEKIFPEMLKEGAKWHDIPPISISYIPYVFTSYFSPGFYGWLSIAFLITGALASYKYEKPILLLLPAIFIPIFLISVQGLSHYPWGYVRFLIFILPIAIIFIAEGIYFFTQKYFPDKFLILTSAITIAILLTWTPQIIFIFKLKADYPWNKAGTLIKTIYKEGDVILGSDWVDTFQLSPFFSEKQYTYLQLDGETLRDYHFDSNPKATIFFVNSSHPIKTTYPSYYFGKIQVILFKPEPGKSVLGMIKGELVNTVKGGNEVAAEFAPLYKNIWDIDKRLNPNNNLYYYKLWVKCFELEDNQRYMPLNLRMWRAKSSQDL